MTVFKLLLKIVVAPVIVLLTLFVWTCVALVYVSGLVLGPVSYTHLDVYKRQPMASLRLSETIYTVFGRSSHV